MFIFRIKSIDNKIHDICMVQTYEECIVFTVSYVTENKWKWLYGMNIEVYNRNIFNYFSLFSLRILKDKRCYLSDFLVNDKVFLLSLLVEIAMIHSIRWLTIKSLWRIMFYKKFKYLNFIHIIWMYLVPICHLILLD